MTATSRTESPIRCTCQHAPSDHAREKGRCRERDSYNVRCTCPSFELENLDWDEAEYREQMVDDALRARP